MLLFLGSPVPISDTHRCITSTSLCGRTVPRANINETGNSAREDEIAAKIASLRKMKRLKTQRELPGGDGKNEKGTPEDVVDVTKPRSFQDLPDWKKEEVLKGQIQEAEAFLSPSRRPPAADEERYKPKVSTWGVFPRPENISRTFGGGKRIQAGGVDLNGEESKKRDAEMKKKLAAYRAGRGIDSELEEKHREEIEEALQKSAELMRRSQPYEAIKTLNAVREFTSENSRVGGQVFLALALGYEAVGKREEAQELYSRLRRSPFPEVSGKAKQLLQGFEAMDMLKINDETSQRGFRVTDFRLPDVSSSIEKRYETALGSEESEETTPLDAGASVLLFLIVFGPIAFVFFVLAPSMR